MRNSQADKFAVALAGNPNVGKSTVFNALTGMNQHTGNWAGKTVSVASGVCTSENFIYNFTDIPGTYSLTVQSPEEEIARNFLCFNNPDAVIVVCDATCLERNLNLVLQIMEINKNVIVCVNLLDQAKQKNVKVNLEKLSQLLGVKVVGTVAHRKKSIKNLLEVLDENFITHKDSEHFSVKYSEPIETALKILIPPIKENLKVDINPKWLALKILEKDFCFRKEIEKILTEGFFDFESFKNAEELANSVLSENKISTEKLKDTVVCLTVKKAEEISKSVVTQSKKSDDFDRRLDKIVTSKTIGYPIMLCFLAGIFWLTLRAANYPSEILADCFSEIQILLSKGLKFFNVSDRLHDCLILGVFRTVSWVVSVMLPPMAVFFSLFTLLEDFGYLPRIAFNLDKPFKRCNACGKQALTMCMGLGCNSVGVTGCRIIDSKRERLLAIITNCFVPCNGKFPTVITIISMFFIFVNKTAQAVMPTLILTAVIMFGVAVTFAVTKLLSVTLLKGKPSSYTLELPPYRKPQFTKVIIHSVFNRTLFVLARAVTVAAPAGLLIWVMANVSIGEISVLRHCSDFLDPFAKLLGLDGVILLSFILGSPANEIVIPITVMAYLNMGSLYEIPSIAVIKSLFVANGWTVHTAFCVILFSLLHWPCATTVLTIKKETASLKWTAISVLVPTLLSITVCMLFNFTVNLF